MTSIVILGATGFIGTHLLEKMSRSSKYKIKILVRKSFSKTVNDFVVSNKIKAFKGDIDNIESLKNVVKKGDIVFNLTASSVPFTSMLNPLSEIKNHLYSQIQLIEKLNKIGVSKIIFTSSGGGVYGLGHVNPISETASIEPQSPHAISKTTIEYYLQYFYKIYQVPYLIYRISNPYGPGQKEKSGFGLVPTLISHAKNNTRPILYNNGKLVRDFIYIEDLIDAIMISFSKKTKHSIYNLGTEKGTSIKKIWQIIKKLSNTSITPIYKEIRPIDAESVVLDISRFKSEFSWEPKITINKGLKNTYLSS